MCDEEGVVTHGARAGSCPGLASAAKVEPKIAQHCGWQGGPRSWKHHLLALQTTHSLQRLWKNR